MKDEQGMMDNVWISQRLKNSADKASDWSKIGKFDISPPTLSSNSALPLSLLATKLQTSAA